MQEVDWSLCFMLSGRRIMCALSGPGTSGELLTLCLVLRPAWHPQGPQHALFSLGAVLVIRMMAGMPLQVCFERPELVLPGLALRIGPRSSVELATTYLDERVRLGRGSRGSRFVFTRGGAADQVGAPPWNASALPLHGGAADGCRALSACICGLLMLHLQERAPWYRAGEGALDICVCFLNLGIRVQLQSVDIDVCCIDLGSHLPCCGWGHADARVESGAECLCRTAWAGCCCWGVACMALGYICRLACSTDVPGLRLRLDSVT